MCFGWMISESVNEYAKVLGEIDGVTMRMVFESYGVEMKKWESFMETTNYLLRSFKYRVAEKGENDVGIHSHIDMSVTSILHQLNNLDGLEVKLKNGEWLKLHASPSFFLVLAGDALQVSHISPIISSSKVNDFNALIQNENYIFTSARV